MKKSFRLTHTQGSAAARLHQVTVQVETVQIMLRLSEHLGLLHTYQLEVAFSRLVVILSAMIPQSESQDSA